MADDTDEFSELRDPDIDSVHAVGEAANGTRILFAKQAASGATAGLFASGFVRDLIAKSTPTTPQQETVTMSGSLAAIAAVIHGAPVRKAEDLDVDTVLADGDGNAPGNVDEPGSPAWEAVDAATARKWTAILARACNALCTLADREMLEAATGDGDDAGKAFDLEDAKCAIDYAIGILAPFAVGEQAAADTADAATVAKALAGFDVDALDTVETFAPVVKAGRVLSAPNEAAIRAAVDSLQRVLASLPAAPTDDGRQVAKAKETPVSDTTVDVTAPDTDVAEQAVAKAKKTKGKKGGKGKKPAGAVLDETVVKAKGDAMLVVFDANGAPVGVCDPKDVMPIADGPAAPDSGTDDDAAQTPVVAAAPAEDAAVIPGTQTIAAPAATDDDTVAKSGMQAEIHQALTDALAPIAQQLAQHAQLADVVKAVQERVEQLAKMPDDRKSPLLNGVTGTGAGIATRDGNAADEFADLRKAVDQAPTEAARRQAEADLFYAKTTARFGG